MKIEFQNIIPEPLKNDLSLKLSFWGSNLTWETPSKTMLNAVSGKGKSTFVDVLTGVRNDFSGSILINGKSISTFTKDEWSELRSIKIATVYQDLQLFNDLSIIENIMVKNDLTNHFSEKKIKIIIKRLGLEKMTNKLVGQLSLGQKQRVAFARAIAQPFKLLLLDEPFSHLDKENETILLEIISEELNINKAGLIITTLGEVPNLSFNTEIIL
jgi:putative ABC transport system ATP-binding protein